METEVPEIAAELFGAGTPLAKKSSRLCPVLVSGSRQSLEKSLAATLAATLRKYVTRGRPPAMIERLEAIAASPKSTGTEVVTLFEEANEYLEKFGNDAEGLILIIDELGKFLEYGASHPDQGDVFVLQELAELANRSKKRPFLFLTILHQGYDRYTDQMSPGRRSEWAKVQGRFEDVAFEERTEQILRLVANAVCHNEVEGTVKPFVRQAESLADDVLALNLRIGSLQPTEIRGYFAGCYPLHPFTTLTAGPLFRQLAQNERSLFAFLSSSEPNGFQEFLSQTTFAPKQRKTYRLDQLYDYIISTLGQSLFSHHRGRAWAEAQATLERITDASELELRVAKTIGLLQAVGTSGPVPASLLTIQLSLGEVASDDDIKKAVETLIRRSVVIFRRHLGSYALWEGSDIDLDARLEAARRMVNRDQPLASFLTQLVPPQPLVARRHYFQMGTLRYYDVRYADRSTLQAELSRDLGPADGRVILCLPANEEEQKAMQSLLLSPMLDAPDATIGAVPKTVFDLREMCHELLCLRWVLQNTPELQTDKGARKEIHHRINHVEQSIRRHLSWVFAPRPGRTVECSWFYEAEENSLPTIRALNNFLSDVCDKVYPSTPIWRNELINRRELSSSAAAARRDLIAAMIAHPTEEFLGIKGVPPERSIYETMLRMSKMHRKKNGEWGFYPPDAKEDAALGEVWKAIVKFLNETEATRLPVERLFTTLRRPPFGLKDGVLPILLAATLMHYDTEVALYEDGTFVPRLSDATFERIFRSPERFDLQRFRVVGPRLDVFQRYAALFSRPGSEPGETPDLLALVKPLVRLVKDLPDYVAKTKQTSDVAQAVHKVIREARQPDRLLFTELPVACGFQAFPANGVVDVAQVTKFFEVLRASLAELQRTYPQLMATIEKLILDALGRSGSLTKARKPIEHEARLVLDLAVDAKLKGFLTRVIDSSCENNVWLESIATLLSGKPPALWDDQDQAKFEVQLSSSARTFSHFRVLAFEMERSGTTILDGDPHMLRVSVTIPNAGDFERVVTVPEEFLSTVERAKGEMRRVLSDSDLLGRRDISVAILAQLTRQLLSEDHVKPEKRG